MLALIRLHIRPLSLRIRTRTGRAVLASVAALAIFVGHFHCPVRAADSDVPRFVVDPYWPKPLPDRWVTGAVGAICVDRQDHVFGVNRSDLTTMEQTVGKQPAPIVIEYNSDGNIVSSWGDPKVMPKSVHGCFVDKQDNIWIGGNTDGIVQKWSHDGKQLLLQIGRKGVCDNSDEKCGEPGGNKSPLLLNEPADIAVDPDNGDIYVADGYGNHRVVVFDAQGKFLRQWGDAGTDRGLFAVIGGGHPHCAVFDRDGLLYVWRPRQRSYRGLRPDRSLEARRRRQTGNRLFAGRRTAHPDARRSAPRLTSLFRPMLSRNTSTLSTQATRCCGSWIARAGVFLADLEAPGTTLAN
jgi:hypothetical protein